MNNFSASKAFKATNIVKDVQTLYTLGTSTVYQTNSARPVSYDHIKLTIEFIEFLDPDTNSIVGGWYISAPNGSYLRQNNSDDDGRFLTLNSAIDTARKFGVDRGYTHNVNIQTSVYMSKALDVT